ncbi:MAG: ANTAR domain-containing response regulator [Hydrogeniiclostridium sp.]
MTEVLLAASGPKTRDLFSSMLGELGYSDILCVSTGREAWRLLQEKSFSLVLIVSPLREGKGFDLAKMAAQTTAGVILICRPILYEEASTRLENTGVFVLSTDMGRRFFNEAVKLMAAVHKRLARAEPQAERMQQKLKDIRIVDKAKCLLIQYEGMTEEDAHRRIEKQAMNRRLPKREIAEEILASYSSS